MNADGSSRKYWLFASCKVEGELSGDVYALCGVTVCVVNCAFGVFIMPKVLQYSRSQKIVSLLEARRLLV